MAKRNLAAETEARLSEYLLSITTDYLVNPSSDTPLSGDHTRGDLEAAGVDVDALIAAGVLEVTDRVRKAS
jgi:hypothetical protein